MAVSTRKPCAPTLKKKGLKPPALLGDAVLLVAAIGGYLGRKNDPPPGHQLLWMGYTAFQHMSAGYSVQVIEVVRIGDQRVENLTELQQGAPVFVGA